MIDSSFNSLYDLEYCVSIKCDGRMEEISNTNRIFSHDSKILKQYMYEGRGYFDSRNDQVFQVLEIE